MVANDTAPESTEKAPERERFTFTIGDAFPATDARARFIMGIAMISNDIVRATRLVEGLTEDDPDGPAYRMMMFRQHIATLHEAARFITRASRSFPEVAEFVASLPDDAQAAYAKIVAVAKRGTPQHGDGLIERYRDTTFHYPEIHPDKASAGKEEILNALAGAAETQSSITVGGTGLSLRFAVADEVVAQWLPEIDMGFFDVLMDAVLAVPLLAISAAHHYLATRPDGSFVHQRG